MLHSHLFPSIRTNSYQTQGSQFKELTWQNLHSKKIQLSAHRGQEVGMDTTGDDGRCATGTTQLTMLWDHITRP